MLGTRLDNVMLGDLPMDMDDIPFGSFWKIMSRKDPNVPLTPADIQHDPKGGNLTNTVWGIMTPNGMYGMLSIHTVREHEDGMISILPGDGSSNSILITGGPDDKQYHGYIHHGEWREC